jgi:hypothetical protein
MSRTDWKALDAPLRRLHGEGNSCAQIAEALGIGSRNAVIGRITRLGLNSGRPTLGARPPVIREPSLAGAGPGPISERTSWERRSARSRAARGPCRLRPEPEQVHWSAAFAEGSRGQTGRLGFMDLRDGLCRFPVEQHEGPDRYCGLISEAGRSYCPLHAAVCLGGLPGVQSGGDRR